HPSQRASHSAGDISSSDFSSQKAMFTVARSCCCPFALVGGGTQSYSSDCVASGAGPSNTLAAMGLGHLVQDPFYTKEKKRKSAGGMLAADAWLDSSLYEFWQTLARWYTRYQDFMGRFHVSGIKRFFVEI